MTKKIFSFKILPFIFALLGGCQGESSDDSGSQTASLKEKVDLLCADTSESESNCATFSEALLVSVENHHYLSGDFTKTHHTASYPSVISIGKNIAVYINNDSAEDFLQVDPDLRGSNAEVEVGTTIIREVWDEASMAKYTAMIKMEAGYFPEGGDFSYIEIGTDGNIISGGKNAECGSCHLTRSSDGFLFGIDSDYRIDLDNLNPTEPEDEFEEAENRIKELARQSMQGGNYLGSDFIQVNQEAFVSDLNATSYIKVYVSDFGYEEYIKANPDSQLPTEINLPEDTVIVRTVENEAGELTKFTLMVKGPEGYYPDSGNFYYGEFDTNAEVVVNADGTANEGALTACGGCHNALRRNMAYLFGVSPTYQTPVSDDFGQAENEMKSLARQAMKSDNYLGSDFKKVNQEAFPSALNSTSHIDVYVSDFAYEEYIKANPDSDTPTEINLPEDTVIVRTVSNEDGELTKFTLMVKGPEGYYPDSGNFYYGEFDADAQVVENADGSANEGALTACGGCHNALRKDMAYLFGVSPSYQTPATDYDEAHLNMMKLARESMQAGNYINSEDFIKVNNDPFPSALNGEDFIELYVSDFAYDEFIKANPDSDTPEDIDIPEDTVIIRSVSNFVGEVSKLTVMVKGPEGYYPDGGDFYYGVFDTNTSVIDGNEGPLTACGSCHNALRKDMAYLFGVSPAYQTPQAQ